MAIKQTEKLVYEATKVAVKINDTFDSPTLGLVTVTNIHAPRKKVGHGRLTLRLEDGRKGDYSPGAINAVWLKS